MSGPLPFAGCNPNLNPLPQMNTLLENLLNGNLKDAKEQAKRFELFKIAGAAIDFAKATVAKAEGNA